MVTSTSTPAPARPRRCPRCDGRLRVEPVMDPVPGDSLWERVCLCCGWVEPPTWRHPRERRPPRSQHW